MIHNAGIKLSVSYAISVSSRIGIRGNVIVRENIVDDTWTDQDVINARNSGNGFGGSQRLIWVYKGTSARTHQNLFDLLPSGSEIISTDGQVYLT